MVYFHSDVRIGEVYDTSIIEKGEVIFEGKGLITKLEGVKGNKYRSIIVISLGEEIIRGYKFNYCRASINELEIINAKEVPIKNEEAARETLEKALK